MLSGAPPARTGVRLNAHGRIPPGEALRGYPLLAQRLRKAGYRTGGFVSASPLAARYGLDQGFERYDDGDLGDLTGLAYAERPGDETVAKALSWLDELGGGEPVFLWIHLFEPHFPYAPAAPPSTPLETRYDMDVHRADQIVGLLLAGLDARRRDDAAVLITSDHGEALDELGERTHGLLLGDAVLRVPFLLRAPGLEPGRRDDPVDVADVAPTLAGLAGLAWPQGDGVGEGRDVLAGEAPDRLRVAESLYAHQLHGWAQLLASVRPDGSMLVDTGHDRLLWLEPAAFGEPQASPGSAAGRSGLGVLGDALRRYRQGERPERISSGGVAAGYGHAGQALPFLPPAENARLPNPYDVIARHGALDLQKARLATNAPPRAVVTSLERMANQDPADPEVRFWLGRAWERVSKRSRRPQEAQIALERAERAYLDAWERGRRDAVTLVLAAGVNALGREAEMIDRLELLGKGLPPDCRVFVLQARLLRETGRAEEADRACQAATEACRTSREKALLDTTKTDETCR